jgi:SAM-dependent methyltransferase
MKIIYSLLEIPSVYSIVQFIFGIGGKKLKHKMLQDTIELLPHTKRLLDVGCGPKSPLGAFGLLPLGADLNYKYIDKYKKATEASGVVCSVDSLPFKNASFLGVWSRGLFHHVADDVAKKGILEMIRVSDTDGYVVILDALLPKSHWWNPLAFLIRKMDRGKYMRNEYSFEALLPDKEKWNIQRFTYNHITRVEMLICILKL